jgi:hypothetical protein
MSAFGPNCKCPLSGVKRRALLHRICPLMTQRPFDPSLTNVLNSEMAPFKLNHMTTGRVSTVKWNTQCNLPRSYSGPCPHCDGEPECFGGGDGSMEIYPSIYLSWHWCGALRWGNWHLEGSSRQRATCLVRGRAWRDVLLGSFCAGALEAPITANRANECRLRG